MSATVLLVRHARAGQREKWDGDDSLRPLDPVGTVQARLLVEILAPFGPGEVLSSPALRCCQTVQPLAEALGMVVVSDDRLREEHTDDAFGLVAALGRNEGGVAVLCTHGDVIPAVLGWIAAEHRVGLPPVVRSAKGGTWVLRAENGRYCDASYIEAPAVAS